MIRKEEPALDTRPFSEEDGRAVCSWRYPSPYDVYDLPAWETACARGYGITNAVRRNEFTAVYLGEVLAGFFRLRPDADGVLLAVGLAPELCGMGLGGKLMALCETAWRKQYGNLPLRLEVRAFNERAVHCYCAAGFSVTDRGRRETPDGAIEFLIMEYKQ